jgi:hypothetical protein
VTEGAALPAVDDNVGELLASEPHAPKTPDAAASNEHKKVDEILSILRLLEQVLWRRQ